MDIYRLVTNIAIASEVGFGAEMIATGHREVGLALIVTGLVVAGTDLIIAGRIDRQQQGKIEALEQENARLRRNNTPQNLNP
ncbi:MAG TPA: hypothetical protein VGT05_04040 [Patescibacteria group bacterium]|nr:hypothetical protein [Patescibacteria group bacterium]